MNVTGDFDASFLTCSVRFLLLCVRASLFLTTAATLPDNNKFLRKVCM